MTHPIFPLSHILYMTNYSDGKYHDLGKGTAKSII